VNDLTDTGVFRLASKLHETTLPAVERICASRDMNHFEPTVWAHDYIISIASAHVETDTTTYRGTCGSAVTEADLRARFGTRDVELQGGQWKAVCRG
jgi:hypothetical protein